MDCHSYAEVFSSLQAHTYVWWNFSTVRIEFVWEDVKDKKLYLILLDQNRHKMAALVPCYLLDIYKQMNLMGGVFSLEHFQVDETVYEYPRYEKYSLYSGEWIILFNKKTKLTPLTSDIERSFALYPLVPSIRTLAQDKTIRKMLIDVVGKIIMGGRVIYKREPWGFRLGSCYIFLQDETGHIIEMRLYDSKETRIGRLARAIKNKSILYASRVKLVHLNSHLNSKNVLSSTELTKVAFDPDIPETHRIRLMLG